jgi:hypothetical protein
MVRPKRRGAPTQDLQTVLRPWFGQRPQAVTAGYGPHRSSEPLLPGRFRYVSRVVTKWLVPRLELRTRADPVTSDERLRTFTT